MYGEWMIVSALCEWMLFKLYDLNSLLMNAIQRKITEVLTHSLVCGDVNKRGWGNMKTPSDEHRENYNVMLRVKLRTIERYLLEY